jgi:adenylate kinase
MNRFDTHALRAITDWLQAGAINIFGRPFAGKDTQGGVLSDLLDAPLLGGGEILRNSTIPPRSQEALKKGLLIPTDEYIQIVLPYLSQEKFRGKPLVLSSVGRWEGEEPSVLQATEQAGHPTKAVFYLDVDEQTVKERWRHSQEERSRGSRGNRTDDLEDILATRLQEFRKKTLPVIDYYQQTPLFCRIDADQPSAEVTAQILDNLLERAAKA